MSCSAESLTRCFSPRLVTLGRCHGIQERVAKVLASQKQKEYCELSLPSYTIAVYSVPTTASTNVDSVVFRNVQVHVAKQVQVCKMVALGESVVWREAMGLGAIKTCLEAHKDLE